MWNSPAFWWKSPAPFWGKILGWLYSQGARLYSKRPLTIGRAPFPVISIGGLVLGGSGKTPTTLMLTHWLKELGWHPVIIARGYGGHLKVPIRVDPDYHSAADVGEETLLLAQHAPTFKSIKRSEALPLLRPDHKTIILLDDGHFHQSLHKDFSVLVVNSSQGIGNGCVFPGGPLREPLGTCLQRAQAIFIIQDSGENIPTFLTKEIFQTKDVIVLESSFSCSTPSETPVVGFSGIGYPQRFEKVLCQLFHEVRDILVFPDHAVYDGNRIRQLEAAMTKGHLVTTEKDWIKLPAWLQPKVSIVHQKLVPQNPQDFLSLLQKWLPYSH